MEWSNGTYSLLLNGTDEEDFALELDCGVTLEEDFAELLDATLEEDFALLLDFALDDVGESQSSQTDEDESSASGSPITQTVELSESRTEYFFNKESVDAPEGYDFTAAEAGGEEVTRLYVTYETITVEKTIHKVRRAVSHAEPGNGDAADETAGGSEASDAAEASSDETAAQEEEFTETVEVEVKVPAFGYETADGAKHEVKEDTAKDIAGFL